MGMGIFSAVVLCGVGFAAGASSAPHSAPEHLADLIDTRRGTDSSVDYSRGNTYPATALPFGFNLWTPLTEPQSHSWLYSWQSPKLFGLALTHQASPWLRDYGTLQVMAHIGHPAADPNQRGILFEHTDEVAKPYRYSVRLANAVQMSVTPSAHAALIEVVYPQAAEAYLSFDDIDETRGKLEVDAAAGVICGHTISQDFANAPHTMFVYAVLRHARIKSYGRFATRHLGIYVGLERDATQPVQLALATSWISLKAARQALEREIGDAPEADVRKAGRAAWDAALAPITVHGATAEQRQMFYNNVYRTLLYPTSMTEDEPNASQPRYYSPYDDAVHAGTMHINNGFWDTYRALWPLHTLLRPSWTGAVLQSFVNASADSGWTPRWTAPGHMPLMVGTHLDAVFADAYVKGIRNFDVDAAYAASLKNATVVSAYPDRGRVQNQLTPFYGFMPDERSAESAAWHLEDCVNDYALGQWAKAMGRADDAAYLDYKASQYANLFSPQVGFFRGRRADGQWRTPDAQFCATRWGHEFIEGAPWHYIMPAPFDALGTAQLYGGPKAMGDKLDAMFQAPRGYDVGSYGRIIHEMSEAYDADTGQYAHANEPVHHLIWMYNSIGRPAATQAHSRAIVDPNRGIYTLGVDNGGGYLGDEDNGQMSAWYIFAAMGLYPVAPGVASYHIGSPVFDAIELQLEHNRLFTIVAQNNAPNHVYVQSATLNHKPYHQSHIAHSDIMAGGTLTLMMGPKPSLWGQGKSMWPPSRTDGQSLGTAYDVVGATHIESQKCGPNVSFVTLLTDNDASSVWYADAAEAEIRIHLDAKAGEQAPSVRQYSLTTGGAAPGCDPATWRLEASQNGVDWQLVDSRYDEAFAWRYQTRGFALARASQAAHYRLSVRNSSGAPCLQVAELELLGRAQARR
jgi:predicted alpha-1,2-mannosidase